MSYRLQYILRHIFVRWGEVNERRVLKLILIIMFLGAFGLSFPYRTYGQNSSIIHGRIVDAASLQPMDLANITVVGSKSGAVSGLDGTYTITTKVYGKLTLECSYVGYQTVDMHINIRSGDSLEVNFSLEPVLLPLSQIVVGSGEPSEYTSGINQVKINNRFLSQVPVVGQKDIFRVIELLPGVKTLSDFSSGLYVRGSKPDETLVRFNQIPVYNPGHFYGFYSIFNPDIVGEVRLFKNPYPASFGGRIGSLLSLRSKSITDQTSSGSLSLGLLSANLSWIGRIGNNASLVLGARRSTLEPVLAGLRAHYQDIPDKFYFWDGTAIFDWGFSRRDHIKITTYLDNDFFSNNYLYDRRDELAYGNAAFGVNETHSFSPNAALNVTFAGSWYHNEPVSYSAGTEYRRRNVVSDEFVKMELQIDAPGRNQITLGSRTGNYLMRLSDNIQQQNILDSRRTALHGSFWLQDTWQPVERWSFTLGLRNNWF
ncbi:MAG TPA: TonB-dependent receptor, partial [Balneolales bacterium]|nr:TonB-dependent receptor [Balneolales bacterium]